MAGINNAEYEFESGYGDFESYATPDGMFAYVLQVSTGKVLKQFRNRETAYQDAERFACDLDVAHRIKNRG